MQYGITRHQKSILKRPCSLNNQNNNKNVYNHSSENYKHSSIPSLTIKPNILEKLLYASTTNVLFYDSSDKIYIQTDGISMSSGGARGVVVITVGNEHGDTSSNPGRYWLHFT